MSEALAVRTRDRVAKNLGLTSQKANIVLRNARNQGGHEIVVMCANEDIRRDCEKLLSKTVDGIPIFVELRPQHGTTPGIRINTNHGRIVQRDM